MKIYSKVEEMLYSTGTNNAIANKIAKLIIVCDDSYLKTLLIEYNRVLKLDIRGYKYITIFKETPLERVFYSEIHLPKGVDRQQSYRYIVKYIRDLIKPYLEQVKAQQKPAWQVEAERNGWEKVR